MKITPQVLPGWTPKRFWSVAGFLFVAQAGLILVFAERTLPVPQQIPATGRFLLAAAPMTEDQLSKRFFAADPTVFAQPTVHGFSDPAWLELPEPRLEVPIESQSPAWLSNDSARLGTNFPLLTWARPILPFGLEDQSTAEVEPWPVSSSSELFVPKSRFRLRGELARRQLNEPADLRAWPGAQLLSNSVVQIAVNSAGQVIAARLLGRSGSTDADTNALAQAWSLRFRPSPTPATLWGRALFEWETVEPPNPSPAPPR